MDYDEALLRLGHSLTQAVLSVAKKHSRSPAKALREYRLLTNSHQANSIEAWFDDVAKRYAEQKRKCMTSESSSTATRNIVEVLQSAMPQGCTSAEQLPDAFDSVLNLIDFDGLSSELAIAHARALANSPRGSRTKWSVNAIASAFVLGALADSRIPAEWWLTDRPVTVQTRRIALRTEPPTLLIEYTTPSDERVRHRRVHLDAFFRPTGSVAALAKKVHNAVAFTGMTVDQLQRHLTRLQALARGGAEPSTAAVSSTSAADDARARAAEVKKADIGLLYRDKHAALANVDLQDADDVTIQEYKNKMDEDFLVKKLTPDDPGYKYDVRKQFKPSAKSEWDDDDD